ncbi:MAG TPA: 3-hydroxyacyl-CoA dehydrogenase [Rhizomicrobium sp.]
MRRKTVAIVGCGVIGRSWSIVFARAGAHVRLFDIQPKAARQALHKARQALRALEIGKTGIEKIMGRVHAVATLEEALDGADYVQESVAENADVKRRIFEQMDAVAAPRCILASSCSAIPPADFMAGLPHEERCLIAHPFNPPHLIPLVELVPAPKTAPKKITEAKRLLSQSGQHPVLLKRPIKGFIGNRLQAAVVNEIMHLMAEEVAGPADLDACLRWGLGLRWSLMGPLETMDLNADGGIADYIGKFGNDYQSLGGELGCREPWQARAVKNVIDARRSILRLDRIGARVAWRDRNLLQLRELLEPRPAGKHPKRKGRR